MKGSHVLALGLLASCALAACLLFVAVPSSVQVPEVKLEAREKAISVQGRHAVLKVLAPTAKLLANSLLFTAVAQHARSNPHKPGQAAMLAVLDDKQARARIEEAVDNKLSNTHSGEYANDIEQEVPAEYRDLIPTLSKAAATQATTMAFIDLRGNVLKAEHYPEDMNKGYLESGNSLADMPMLMGSSKSGQYGPVAVKTLEFKCRDACERNHLCKAFTYKPSQGVCYLKNQMNPVRGTDCTDDCWFFGVVQGRV